MALADSPQTPALRVRERAVQVAIRAAYFLLRVVAGLLFFQAGSMILLGWFGGMPGQPGSTAPLMSEIGIGGVLEFVGGLAIMLGLLTRPVAFILSGEMAVAYWQFHAPDGAWPIQKGVDPLFTRV